MKTSRFSEAQILAMLKEGVVGLPLPARSGHRQPEQTDFQFLVAHALSADPVHAGGAREPDELGGGGLRGAQRTSDLSVAQAGFVMQAKGVSNLAQGGSGNGYGGRMKSATMPAIKSLAPSGFVRDQLETPSAINLKRRPRSA